MTVKTNKNLSANVEKGYSRYRNCRICGKEETAVAVRQSPRHAVITVMNLLLVDIPQVALFERLCSCCIIFQFASLSIFSRVGQYSDENSECTDVFEEELALAVCGLFSSVHIFTLNT